MNAQFYKTQIKRVLQMVDEQVGDQATESSSMSVSEILDPTRFAQEKAMFRRLPLIVGHSSQIPGNGDYIVRQIDSKSWLIVRGKDGQVRAFYNYCQHRGTKLVHDSQGQCQHRFVCPYHAWTYSNQGDLVGVPRADLFPGLDKKDKPLKQVGLKEAYGFLWMCQDPEQQTDIKNYMGALDQEMSALGLENYHVFFDKTRELKANWKLPIFAFLESYHLAVLHKDSIGDFFHENVAHSEILDPHIRSFVPRRNAAQLADLDLSEVNLSEYITPTNIIFPNVCIISHPSSLTVISMFPGETPGTCTWRHMLLTPKKPETDAELAHYNKTVAVLDGITYEKEDFWASEQSQEGMNAGALDELVLAKNENLLQVFNQFVKDNL